MDELVCMLVWLCEETGREEAGWCQGLRSVKCFDLVKCFLQAWN